MGIGYDSYDRMLLQTLQIFLFKPWKTPTFMKTISFNLFTQGLVAKTSFKFSAWHHEKTAPYIQEDLQVVLWSLTLVPSHGCLTILRYLQDKDGLAALHLKGKWWREPLKFHQPYRSEPGQWDIKHRNHSNHCSTSSCSKLHIQVVSDRFMSLASNFKFIQSWCLYELHPSKYL